MEERPQKSIERLTFAGCIPWLLLFLLTFPIHSYAADQITTAEAAIARFRTACDGDIKQSVSSETMKRIMTLRDAPFLMVARKSHVDVTDFIDPKVASALSHDPFYGSPDALAKSTGDVWVLTYGNMSSLTAYIDAASGKILCVALVPEG
jgi:hypothetical protein